MSVNLDRVQGVNLRLRLVVPEDARYIQTLRINPDYNRHLSEVGGGVEDQRIWIKNYKVREKQGLEYYFIIERLDGLACGVVRLYDISDDTFTWGSWILDHNKPAKAALESAVLSFGFGFETLDLEDARFDVRVKNEHAYAFYQRFGATEVGHDDSNIYFEYTREKFLQDHGRYAEILKGATIRNKTNE